MNNKKNGLYLTAFLLCLNLSTEAHGVAFNKTDAMRESGTVDFSWGIDPFYL